MPKQILTVFAHPDDAECVAGGTLLRWAREGHRITLCLVTSGDKGSNDPADSRETVVARRRVEQARAAARLGAEVLELGLEDGYLQPTMELRRELVRVMRRLRPDVVLSHDPTHWFRHGIYINHPDHRAVGQALLEAIYPAVKKPGTFPELLAEGLEPHVVPELWLAPTDGPNTWVDIGETMEEKVALICEHASQFPLEPTRAAFTAFAHEDGAARGLAFAETFRVVRLARQTVAAFAAQANAR